MTLARYIRLVGALAAALVLTGCRLGVKSISLADYVGLELRGLSGRADAAVTIDEEGIYAFLAGADATEEEKLKYEPFVGSLKATADKTAMVANGDEINVIVTYDAAAADELKVDVQDFATSLGASGLPEGKQIDVFADLEVMVSGVAPYAFVTITNKSEDPYIKNLEYTVKGKTTGLANGDEIEVVAAVDADRAAQFLYYTDVTTMTYKVEGIDSYIYEPGLVDAQALSDIAAECARTILAATADTTTRMMYTISGDNNYLYQDNNEKVNYVNLNQVIFGAGRDGAEYENVLYFVFSAQIANYNYTEDGYFIFTYTNAIMTADGMLIGHNNPELRYVCGKDFDSLYADVTAKAKGDYDMSILEDVKLYEGWMD